MSFTPLTQEQYQKAVDSGFSNEDIIQFEKQRKSQENSDISNAQVPKDSMATQGIGFLKEHPIKALLQGLPETITGRTLEDRAVEDVNKPGFMQSKTAPFDKNIPAAGNAAFGEIVAGQVGDMSTAPGNYALPAIASGAARVLKPLLKYDNALQQAQKAKVALDSLRKNIGNGVELAIKDVANVPTNLNIKSIPEKVFANMKKSVYQVEFDNSKKLVNSVGNLNKVKESAYDLLTSGDFVQASNAEKAQIRQFAGSVSKEMRVAARKAGKPIDNALDSYSQFMKRYEIINPKLVDKYGNAMGNKLKNTFAIMAEPATKKAWQDVAKASPEIKSVMNSMKRRELLKNLLKATGVAAGTAEVIKKEVTGSF